MKKSLNPCQMRFFRKTAGTDKFISAMLFSAFFLANGILVKAQILVTEEWVRTFSGPDSIFNTPTAIDVNHNVYVAGAAFNLSTGEDFVVLKYTPAGDLLWVSSYNGPGNGFDRPMAIVVDGHCNAYVTGMSHGIGTDFDIATVKYDSAGTVQWVSRYDGPVSGFDLPSGIALDTAGNVYVTGFSDRGAPAGTDIVTICYDHSGLQSWERTYGGTFVNGFDFSSGIATDTSGNVYVVGSVFMNNTSYDAALLKYDSQGTEQWARLFDGAGLTDNTSGLALSGSNHIYVTGFTQLLPFNEDYLTLLYDASGKLLWSRTYNGPGNGRDVASSLVADTQGNVTISGLSFAGTNPLLGVPQFDLTTVRYDSAATQLWTQRFSGPLNGFLETAALNLAGTSIASDNQGNVYVGGSAVTDTTVFFFGNDPFPQCLSSNTCFVQLIPDYATIKYDAGGNQQWVQFFGGVEKGFDQLADLDADDQGNVYVTGLRFGGQIFDIATIKYSQQPPVFTVEDIDLGSASSFAVLAGGDIIANDPISAIGNVGAVGTVSDSISASDTLFPSNDPKVQQAIVDLSNAINIIENIPVDTTISGNLGGQTLSEGVYEIAGNALLNGILTLIGDTASIYVFKIADSLIVDSAAVLELGNVLPQNVYWVTLSSYVSIGNNVRFSGIVMTNGNIVSNVINTGMLTLLTNNGNITLLNNNLIQFSPIFSRGAILNFFKAPFAPFPLTCPSCTTAPDCELVCNGGFENKAQCPPNTNFWFSSNVCNWYPISATPDYWFTDLNCNPIRNDVPNNGVGCQDGHNGSNAYAGVITYSPNQPQGVTNYREYIQQQLIQPLVVGQQYSIIFNSSLAERSEWATDGLGVCLSTSPFTSYGQALTCPGTYIYNNNVNTNTTGWSVPVAIVYVATAPYSYITIGNFNNDASTTVVDVNPGFCGTASNNNWAYYYIDDVSVTPFNNPLTVVTASPGTICLGESSILSANLSGTWTPSSTLSSSTGTTVTATPTVTTTYTVCVTDINYNCEFCKSVTVTVNPLPVADAGPDVTICSGDGILLNATGGVNYSWFPTTGLSDPGVADPLASPTTTTTYTVTVISANGCTDEDNVTVFVNHLTIDPLPDLNICIGISTQIIVNITEGLPPFTCIWTPTTGLTFPNGCESPPFANPTETTTYTITVTDANGCTASDDVTVSVSTSPPTADFTFDPFDNCEGSGAALINNSTGGVFSSEWDFGDGQTFTNGSESVSHFYHIPGYFQITLTVSNGCGTSDPISKIIYIIPSTPDYNPGCCIADFSYDVIDADITTNSIIAGSVFVKGTITVKAGNTLTGDPGAVVHFGPQGKVIVEPGALLILNGTTFTSIDYSGVCPSGMRMMWQGVEVWGDGNSSNPADQGKITLQNGAKIEDAHNGVMLGRSVLLWDPVNNRFFNSYHDFPSGGGIIQATNSYFNRNAVSVRFWDYGFTNSGIIIDCNFTCKTAPGGVGVNNTPLLDPYYNHNNAPNVYNTSPIWEHNPFYANPHNNTEGRSQYSIFQSGVKNVIFINNSFEHVEIAMISFEARYNVLNSVFTNIIWGIRVVCTNSSFFGHVFNGNTFKNFQEGIFIDGDKYTRISNINIFNPLPNPGPHSSNFSGIHLVNTTNFTIVDNVFNRLGRGILCTNSGGSAVSLIGYQNGGNIFTQCRSAIVPNSNNNMLNIRCNAFDNPIQAEYTLNWLTSSQLAQQGEFSLTDEKKPAGNRFVTPSRKEISTNIGFDYFAHSAPADRIPVAAGPVTINSNSIASSSFQASCATDDPCNKGDLVCKKGVVDNLGNEKIILEQEFAAVESNLDNGNTAGLLTAIVSNIPKGQLKDTLVNNSPLSDTVLIEFINNSGHLQPGHFKEVMIPNLPVSNNVKPHLDIKLATLPNGIANEIRDAQVSNPGFRTLTAISRDISSVENQRQLELNTLIMDALAVDSNALIINLLEDESTIESRQLLVGIYIGDSNYVAASAKLNTLPLNTIEDIAFFDLYNMYIDLGVAGKTLWEMNTSQEQLVRDIAALCPTSLAKVNAQAVLQLVFGELTPDCPQLQLKTSGNEQDEYISDIYYSNERITMRPCSNNAVYLGNNIPNPFNKNTVISYCLPEDTKNALISISNITGQILKTYPLAAERNFIEISTEYYGNGIFFYSLIIDGYVFQTMKMVIIK